MKYMKQFQSNFVQQISADKNRQDQRENYYAYLLNVEPSNLMILKTYSNQFNEIIITFRNKNDSALEVEGKINQTLPIDKYKWHVILELRTRKYLAILDFDHFLKTSVINKEKSNWLLEQML